MSSQDKVIKNEGFKCLMAKRICLKCGNSIKVGEGLIDLGICEINIQYSWYAENKRSTSTLNCVICESRWEEFKKNIDKSLEDKQKVIDKKIMKHSLKQLK